MHEWFIKKARSKKSKKKNSPVKGLSRNEDITSYDANTPPVAQTLALENTTVAGWLVKVDVWLLGVILTQFSDISSWFLAE